jgi:branched-chain amino acid aminotransferase
MPIFYVDGQFIPAENAMIPVQDLSVLRGYGVFDFMRTYGGRPFHLDDHIRRLAASARHLELTLPCSAEQITALTLETLTRNGFAEAGIRIVVTGGASLDSITPTHESKLLIMVMPLSPCPGHWYAQGAAVITLDNRREMPQAKSLNYSAAILAMSRARREGAIEAIYCDGQGGLLEGTTSNIFAFKGDELVTPQNGILPGITQRVILDLAAELFPVKPGTIRIDEIPNLDEAFITASNKEVVPIVRIDGHTIGPGRPGERTRKIMAAFAAYTKAYGEGG